MEIETEPFKFPPSFRVHGQLQKNFRSQCNIPDSIETIDVRFRNHTYSNLTLGKDGTSKGRIYFAGQKERFLQESGVTDNEKIQITIIYEQPSNQPIPGQLQIDGNATSPAQPILQNAGFPQEWVEVFNLKKEMIFYGPPGTGKTYYAIRFAKEWLSNANFNKGYSELNAEEKEKTENCIQMVTFHPTYSYEEFIEGIMPDIGPAHKGIHYSIRSGIFKGFCDTAKKDPKNKYILIIDEINRGNIAKIFGELITIIEKDKRGTQVILPYSRAPFTIPDNLYIIGTMNTADQSIALVDIALRRRFAFIEMQPNYELLDQTIGQINLSKLLKSLNDRIRNVEREKQIGHSYFMVDGRPIVNMDNLIIALKYEVIPLLQEYFYNDYKTLSDVLGTDFINDKKDDIKWELFESHEKVTNALLRIINGSNGV